MVVSSQFVSRQLEEIDSLFFPSDDDPHHHDTTIRSTQSHHDRLTNMIRLLRHDLFRNENTPSSWRDTLRQIRDILSSISLKGKISSDEEQHQLLILLKLLLVLSATYEDELVRIASLISKELDTWRQARVSYASLANLTLSILPDVTYGIGVSFCRKTKSLVSPGHWSLHFLTLIGQWESPYNASPLALIRRSTRDLERLRLYYAEKLGQLVEMKKGLISLNPKDIKQLYAMVNTISDTLKRVTNMKLDKNSTHESGAPLNETRSLIYHLEQRLHVGLQGELRHCRYPTGFRTYWFYAIGGFFAAKYLLNQRTFDLIHNGLQEAYLFTKTFVVEWFVKPIENIYNTIRHKDRQLAVLSAESLQSDLQSLERMVLDYARDQGQTDIEHVADRVRQGDLTVVMEAYEDQIRSPIRSALSGNLLRSLLIQIQKAKVDGEFAMSALDKLLKANELNFALLATIPTMLVTYSLTTWVYDKLQGRHVVFARSQRTHLRSSLRRFERIVDTYSQGRLNTTTAMGLLMFEMVYLKSMVSSPSSGMNSLQKAELLQDLEDLEFMTISDPSQLKPVVTRMWRTIQF